MAGLRVPPQPAAEHHYGKESIMDTKLELVPVPVTDVDRAKAFYTDKLGFVLDVDVRPSEQMRVVQLTPPGSACSIVIGTGLNDISDMTPGSQKGLHLVVADIESAREELLSRGVSIGELVDVGGGVRYAWLTDPDGNSLLLQEMAWRTGDDF
jgi:predicted enzyme related to lactoylglutathione lyase